MRLVVDSVGGKVEDNEVMISLSSPSVFVKGLVSICKECQGSS